MPCNLVNFILVNRESEVGRGRQRGKETREKERSEVEKPQRARKGVLGGEGGIGYHHHRFDDVQHVRSAQSLCRR